MSSSILLINTTCKHSNQIQVILEFLGYKVLQSDFTSLQNNKTLEAVCAIFIENEKSIESSLTQLREQGFEKPIVLINDQLAEHRLVNTSLSNIINAVIAWPFTQTELSTTLQSLALDKTQPKPQRRSVELFRSLSGESPAIQHTRKLIDQVADRDVTVLILGESGTGKEVVARNLHYQSRRRHQPFVPVNCGAIPAELLESELFGHEKGAFTGAFTARQGRFELAEGGTLFLDEIGDLPLAMQVKLLRVIQEKTFERVGGTRTINSDVRIIAATHHNLQQEIQEKRFREDLYYRLNVFPIDVPALRQRSEDIPVLVGDLTARMEREKSISIKFTKTAMEQLQTYSWPGNVRELANVVERMAILIPDGIVDIEDLPDKFPENHQPSESFDLTTSMTGNSHDFSSPLVKQLPDEGINLKEQLLSLEQNLIAQALEECNGVVAQAARKLSLNRTTLVEKMRKFGLDKITEE